MGISTLIDNDLPMLYRELRDTTAVYNGTAIDVIYDTDYEISSVKEKIIRVQAKDVIGLSNSDTITIDGADYKVISFNEMTDGREIVIGLEK